MFENTFTKTFYEKRWLLIAWSAGLFAMTFVTMLFYPYLKNSGFEDVVKDAPKSLQTLLGTAANYQTVAGYVGQQIFSLRLPVMSTIMAIALFSGISAGDENRGTEETLLAQPISRTQVFWQKFAAGAVIMALACTTIMLAALASFPIINGSMDLLKLFEATVGCWLISMVFGALTYCMGRVTGKKGLTVGIGSAITFTSYLISSLAPAVQNLDTAQKVSVFYYYNTPSIADHGVRFGNIVVLCIVMLVALAIGQIVFTRRDLVRD